MLAFLLLIVVPCVAAGVGYLTAAPRDRAVRAIVAGSVGHFLAMAAVLALGL